MALLDVLCRCVTVFSLFRMCLVNAQSYDDSTSIEGTLWTQDEVMNGSIFQAPTMLTTNNLSLANCAMLSHRLGNYTVFIHSSEQRICQLWDYQKSSNIIRNLGVDTNFFYKRAELGRYINLNGCDRSFLSTPITNSEIM